MKRNSKLNLYVYKTSGVAVIHIHLVLRKMFIALVQVGMTNNLFTYTIFI